MKFTIPSKAFTDAISAVGRVVEKRNTIPILSNIVIGAAGESIHLRATDLDLQISLSASATIEEPGETTVPADLLRDIVRKMAGDITVLADKEGQFTKVSSGRSRFQLQALPVDDYPDITTGAFTHSFKMTGAELHRLISKVEFAISTEETRYYLNGVFLHVDDGKLKAVSTDGHRLAKSEMEAPGGAEGMPGIIIPRKTVKELVALADAAKQDEISIELSDSKIRIGRGSAEIVSKLIDGTFPDYQRVIPTGSNIFAKVDSKTLSSASDRVSTVSSERGRAVKLVFSNGRLELSVNNPDAGSAQDDIDIDYDADPLEIGFNARYLTDVCAAVGAGETKISLTGSGSPTIFTSEANEGFLVVLMPMRI